jgi:hypothetical protein
MVGRVFGLFLCQMRRLFEVITLHVLKILEACESSEDGIVCEYELYCKCHPEP